MEAGGKHLKDSYEAWITTDPFRGGVRVVLGGPLGLEPAVQFALDEVPSEITNRVRLTLEESMHLSIRNRRCAYASRHRKGLISRRN